MLAGGAVYTCWFVGLADAQVIADGAAHVWRYAGRAGQRRCDVCFVFGYISKIMTGHPNKQPHDSQGVVIMRCELRWQNDGVKHKCNGYAVGKDPLTPGHSKHQWRCRHHRSEYAVARRSAELPEQDAPHEHS